MQHVVCYTTSSAHFGVACTKRVARCSKRHTSFQCPKTHARRTAVLIRAQDAPKPAAQEDDFEARIAALKVAKGQTPMGEGKKKGTSVSKAPASASSAKVDYDYTNEKVYLETPPSYGDLAVNMALGFTLVWLPLTIAAVGRTAFVRYRFTDQRISVITNAPWKQEQLDAAYQEVKSVIAIGRGVGIWGDMVVELRSGDKIEMRAVPQWQELRDYITERVQTLRAAKGGSSTMPGAPATQPAQGFGN